MEKRFTLGLGIIHAEKREIRAFLPDFVAKVSRYFKEIILEDGYGKGMGFDQDIYTKSTNVHFAPAEKVYAQDHVLVLRYPSQEYLELMKPGSCLISMCHFPTRPKRREYLKKLGLEAISLDAINDDNGGRMVENLRSVAWNGCEIAFKVLQEVLPAPGLQNPVREPLNITLLGSGGVGSHAVPAAIRYGDPELWQHLAAMNIPGNIVRVIDFDLTNHTNQVRKMLPDTDLLIDATQRKNPTQIIIPNILVGLLPEQSVILDLSVDPYDFHGKPYEVKGIEGIPQGDLDHYIFPPDDPAWDAIADKVSTTHRRWTVSCYSWPGIHPRECMIRYGNQIAPLMRHLVSAGGVEGIKPSGQYLDRALARAMLMYWAE